jgi:Domain of unknown function (DUF4280)
MSKYVPKNVHLVCSNGMTKSDLIVKYREAKIISGQLWGTIEDKPNNFACKWAALIAAAIAAIIAVAVIGTGGLAAVAIGAAVGAAVVGAEVGAGAMGFALCNMATKNAQWIMYHQTVTLGGKKMLLETSTLTCKIGFGGQVYIFYSEAAANRQRNAFATRNAVEILGAAGFGAFIGSGLAILSTSGLFSAQMGIYAAFGAANYKAGEFIDGKLDAARDATAAYLVPYNTSVSESEAAKNKNQDNDAFEKATFGLDDAPSLISDPIILHRDIKDGTAKPEETPKVNRGERRREYNRKTKPVKDKNGTLRRPKDVPKSLSHDTRANPANKAANITRAQNRAAAAAYLSRKAYLSKFGKGLRDFAIVTAFTWVVDVASASLQRDADNNRETDEAPAKALVNVQAENF